MTDGTTTPHTSNLEEPEARHLALITALIKIFATDRGDTLAEPAPQRP